MEIEVIFYAPSSVKIDLEHYGHDENTEWMDLSDDEQNDILDILSYDIIPQVKDVRQLK